MRGSEVKTTWLRWHQNSESWDFSGKMDTQATLSWVMVKNKDWMDWDELRGHNSTLYSSPKGWPHQRRCDRFTGFSWSSWSTLYISPMGIRQDTTIWSQPVYLRPRSFFWIRNTTCTFKQTANDPKADRGGAAGQLFFCENAICWAPVSVAGLDEHWGMICFLTFLCCRQWVICRVLLWEGLRWKRHGL